MERLQLKRCPEQTVCAKQLIMRKSWGSCASSVCTITQAHVFEEMSMHGQALSSKKPRQKIVNKAIKTHKNFSSKKPPQKVVKKKS